MIPSPPLRPPPSVLYAGGPIPAEVGGGEIVIDRHLRHLASLGHSVSILHPAGSPPPCGGPWAAISVPARRPGWPPFRPGLPSLCRLRSAFIRRYLESRGLRPARRVLTICPGAMSWLAADLARAWRVPLIAIVHDWWGEQVNTAASLTGDAVCRHADRVLAVSREMADALEPLAPGRVEVLPPLPSRREAPFASWREQHAERPVLVHVGALHLYQVSFLASVANALRQVGGSLLVICPAANPVLAELRNRCPAVTHHDYFPTHREALTYVAAHATALIVMYPQAEGSLGRPPTGFPSRLVEFVQLGLPTLLAAPPANPVRTWAARRGWRAALDPDDHKALLVLVRLLVTPEGWSEFAADALRAYEDEFNAETIERQLVAELARSPVQP